MDDLLPEHRDDIALGRALNGDVINFSQRLLSKQFPEVGGFQTTFFNARPSFQHASGVQIHYTKQYHWVTSSTIGSAKVCCAGVFDSKWSGKLSTHTKIQIRGTLHVEISPVHQQNGAVDCGVFAIAFATDLCHGLDPVAVAMTNRRCGHI